MEFFSHCTKIDFMAQRKLAFTFSIFIVLLSLFFLSFRGLNLGLDFTGGVQLEYKFSASPSYDKLRDELAKNGMGDALVQAYGDVKNVMVKLKLHKGVDQQQLVNKVSTIVGIDPERVDVIGAQVGKTLVVNSFLSIIVALLGTMLYIAFRFEYRFAISAVISLIHDPLLILGVFSFFQVEFDLIALAAILTVLGYSLNDTIVVYDRVRENFRKFKDLKVAEILNLSINQTLSRTIIISGLTFLVVACLFVFGGRVLHGFSLAMMIGIVIGTYSSIYIAGAIALLLGLKREHLLRKELH